MGMRHSSSHGLRCAYLLGMPLAIGKFHIVISSDGFRCSWLTLKGGIVTPLPSEQSRWASYRVTVRGLGPEKGRGWSEVQTALYSFSSVPLVRVPVCAHTVNSGFAICWETVILVSSTKIATLSHRRVIFDRCISDTLGTAVKTGTWWNSTNAGSGHSWKDSWARGSTLRTTAGECGFGLAFILKSSWFIYPQISRRVSRLCNQTLPQSRHTHFSGVSSFVSPFSWSPSPLPTGNGHCPKCKRAEAW